MARYRRRSKARRFLDLVATVALFAGVALVVAFLDERNTEQIEGRFEVVDGDSLRQNGRGFRLLGIDAPEYRQTCQRNGAEWACGRVAREHLQSLMAAGRVQCKGYEIDKFDRLLVRCMSGETLINRQMVADGFAVSFGEHQDVERAARAASLGLWASEFDRPSDWRDLHQGSILEVEHISGLRDYAQSVVRWIRSLFAQGEMP